MNRTLKILLLCLAITSLTACCPGCYRHGGGWGRGDHGGR
jgi:hypothetical protein